ncbi:galactose oxidase [Alteromonas mediterranea]|uniref:Kelch repeat-containing protein n=1 Tax=Alteromonas mediterranea TaxID=314275 RepID=UPI0009045B04|nr:galactose oxidase [Alteromonas mediterranea]APD94542.1 galactose oxidase [Alteromonas mediterranea]APD98179.1 galactose oxidase [Alteromonas mediterranea]
MLLKKPRTIALHIFQSAVPRLSFVVAAFIIASAVTVSAAAEPIVLPALPEPVSNNAVASVTINDTQYVFSFMGLGKGKTYKDVHNRAWQLVINNNDKPLQWQALSPVPSSLALKGRLASVAVGVKDSVYIFGGYTVDEHHNEISTPDVYKYSPTTEKYTLLTPMPVPVDDATALVYQDRYVYLVSGWHNDGNVNLVQVYDTQTGQWQQASPFLGNPVFGQAGGIVNNTMVICDGVSVTPHIDKRRSFAAETACFKGVIDKKNPLKIDWRTLNHPTGSARYRMAAAGDEATDKIYFVGGSTNPYNYNGIGYNGEPSTADDAIWAFDIAKETWVISKTEAEAPTMDHRGLINVNGSWVTIGGMLGAQRVTSKVTTHFSALVEASCSPRRQTSSNVSSQSSDGQADERVKTAPNLECQHQNNKNGEK